jgi:hypothetical protein
MRYNTIANAAREGARYGIIHPSDVAAIEAAARDLTTGLDPSVITVLVDYDASLYVIQVTVTYDHGLITGPVIAVLGGSGTIPLQASAKMRVEQIP